MQPATILLALFTASGMCAPSSAGADSPKAALVARQEPTLADAQAVLQGARNAAMEAIESGRGNGRRLGEQACSTLCEQCRTGAVTVAVGEIAICGTAALAIAAAAGPLGVFLDLVGFTACEAIAIGALNQAEAECLGLP